MGTFHTSMGTNIGYDEIYWEQPHNMEGPIAKSMQLRNGWHGLGQPFNIENDMIVTWVSLWHKGNNDINCNTWDIDRFSIWLEE